MKWIVLFFLVIELMVTITLAGKIGGLNTFVEIIVSGLLGFAIMINFKKTFMNSLIAVMSRQISAQQIMAGNFLALAGAVLLLIPGFFTDFIGLLMQLGFVKNALAMRIKTQQPQKTNYSHKGDDDVIDVEIIEHDAISK